MRVMFIIFLNDDGRMMGLRFTLSFFFGGLVKELIVKCLLDSFPFYLLY